MDLSPQEIRQVFVSLFVLIISVALHEFGHAWMADHLGDDTPRRQGRVTLNPIAHADPIGTLLLPVLGSIHALGGGGGGGFGWGKPVQWNPSRIRRGIKMSTANILVSLAGPGMNLLLATFLALVHAILLWQGVVTIYELDANGRALVDASGYLVVHPATMIFFFAVTTNFVLFFFNLIPCPPLDGGHILQAFMPYRHRDKYDSIARFGPFLLLAIMLIPQLRWIFTTPAMWCMKSVYQAFGALFGIHIL